MLAKLTIDLVKMRMRPGTGTGTECWRDGWILGERKRKEKLIVVVGRPGSARAREL